MTRFIFVTGGVVSSLGKGIAAASIGYLLKRRGLSVTLQKCDPYLNVDPGTMSPFQHGEVYVTDDGAETDLDLGHYERFAEISLSKENNVTAGSIYDSIITRERRGDFLGKTVQVIPHVTNEIKRRMRVLADREDVDCAIVEIGGTVGDIESLPFLEAIRQLRLELGADHSVFVHVTLVPYIKASREMKTKPTQHSVKALREIGIQPDILICRTEHPMRRELLEKIGLFCNVEVGSVIEARDVASIYEVPLVFHRGGLDARLAARLGLDASQTPDLTDWEEIVDCVTVSPERVTIAIAGKYVHLHDAYKSIIEACTHGGVAAGTRVDLRWVDSEAMESEDPTRVFEGVDGILVPGGFGQRGTDGMVRAVRHARTNGIPYFGICLGFQCMLIELARNVLDLEGANSSEFDAGTPHPIIDLMAEQAEIEDMGGTMRLGAYDAELVDGSRAFDAYGTTKISERHRHRYEFNNEYREQFEAAGIRFSGVNPARNLVEIAELPEHPWFVGVQYHPELKSRPRHPHPLFSAFVRAAQRRRKRSPFVPEVDALFRPGGPFFVISGPCVIESEEMLRTTATRLREAGERTGVPVVLKASYTKDNRTSGSSFRGPGLERGLEIFSAIGRETGLPITSDVHSPEEASRAGEVLDILQIPAFLCRQSSLLEAAARTGRPLNIKKGQFLPPSSVTFIVEKAREAGARRVGVTERGASFGYGDLVVDPRVFPIMRELPIVSIYDATHSLQRPGGSVTGGDRRFARALTRAALAAGARAVFFETHPDPDSALSDRETQLPLERAQAFLAEMARVAAFVREIEGEYGD